MSDSDRETGVRAAYGTLEFEPGDDVVVGTYGTWTITYTVGAIGMDDGSRLKVAANVTSDWGPPQFDDPGADNYCTAETTGDAEVTGSFRTDGHVRPWRDTIVVDVYDGALAEGEEIVITLGDRSGGSQGFQAQSYPESDFTLIGLVDAFETGEFVRLEDTIHFDVVAGSARSLRAVAPSTVELDQEVTVSVSAHDYWGNVVSSYDGTLRVADDRDSVEAREVSTTEDGVAHFLVRITEPSVYRLDITDPNGDLATTTNPIRCGLDGDGSRTYWGDIHGQSEETVGTGTIHEYFDFAERKAFLDFASHAGNDFQITDEFWETIQSVVRDRNDPGEFVTFLCYEWSANTPNGGDHNVYFLNDEAEIHRSSSWQVNTGSERHEGTFPAERLYEMYEGRDDVLIIPHRGGRPATLDAVDPDLTPFVEILSVWGVFEWYGREALERGYKIGFVAGSDDHTGRPGASYPANVTDWSFPIKGGLMAANAEDLSRKALWDAFTSRRVYGTTGARILLDVSVSGTQMGDEVTVDKDVKVDITVNGTAPIDRIELFRFDEPVESVDFNAGNDRVEFVWTGARAKTRHKVQDWSGGLTIDRGRIRDVEEVGFDHPAQGVTSVSDTAIRWNGKTAGNYQGVRVEFEDAPATVDFSTPPLSASIDLEELDEERVFDAGPVERQLSIRRIGSSSTWDVEHTFEDAPTSDGVHPYYVRVTQADGEMAWSSPVFVTVEET